MQTCWGLKEDYYLRKAIREVGRNWKVVQQKYLPMFQLSKIKNRFYYLQRTSMPDLPTYNQYLTLKKYNLYRKPPAIPQQQLAPDLNRGSNNATPIYQKSLSMCSMLDYTDVTSNM